MILAPYGAAPNPGSPGTWQRDVWWALNRAARIGAAPNSRKSAPPFHFLGYNNERRLLVTAGAPTLPYGRSTSGKGYLTHLTHTVLFAWDRGEPAGWMMAWQCGARTAYFRMIDEPDSPICAMCVFRASQFGAR
jgi:hypothetical protein